MKSYNHFKEDLEQRRAELKQRQMDQLKAANDANQMSQRAKQEEQQRKKEREAEKDELKGEIKQELRKELKL